MRSKAIISISSSAIYDYACESKMGRTTWKADKMKKKIINIYITPLEQKRLNEYKEKYHISYSTIANIVTEKMMLLLPYERIIEMNYENKGRKTSIKPRNQYNTTRNLTKLYTNALKIFLNKEIGSYVKDQKKIDKTYNFIFQEMQDTYEPNYNGNYLNRMIPKIIKSNKEYYRKIIDEC